MNGKSNPIQSNEIKINATRESSESSISTDSDCENYIIKTNVCKRLSKELDLQEMIFDEGVVYDPPTETGLENCNCIIPSYYHLHKHPSKIFTIDYFEIIKDDIRNYRPLNKYQLEYIKHLSHENKDELLTIFNECVVSLIAQLN